MRAAAIIGIGIVLAALMVLLGIWQLDVYQAQGQAAASRRAAEPAVQLTTVAPPAAAVQDGYGRTVEFSGTYRADLQLLVPDSSGRNRVLTGLQQADGSIVPVVRGIADRLTTPPSGAVDEAGVLLPTEEAPAQRSAGGVPAGDQLAAVQLPVLAQRWPGPLIGGFVVLSVPDATAQGLTPAVPDLPAGTGRLRNGAYALQWWVFAAFAIALSIRMARDGRLGATLPGSSDDDPAMTVDDDGHSPADATRR